MCVAYIRPANLGNIFTYHKIDRLDGPWSPPIWSRDWGPFLFLNQYERDRRREMRKRESGERE